MYQEDFVDKLADKIVRQVASDPLSLSKLLEAAMIGHKMFIQRTEVKQDQLANLAIQDLVCALMNYEQFNKLKKEEQMHFMKNALRYHFPNNHCQGYSNAEVAFFKKYGPTPAREETDD